MKLLMENWRRYLNEEVWADYGHDKGSWEEMNRWSTGDFQGNETVLHNSVMVGT